MIALLLMFLSSIFATSMDRSAEVVVRVGYNRTRFSGVTCPNCLVYFRHGDVVYGTTLSDDQGRFSKEIEYLPNGTNNIKISTSDSLGRSGAAISNIFSLSDDANLDLSNLLLAPTVSYEKKGFTERNFYINGSSIPNTYIFIEYVGTGKIDVAKTTSEGEWNSKLEVGEAALGTYGFRLKLKHGDAATEWGPVYSFDIFKNPFLPTPTLTPKILPSSSIKPTIPKIIEIEEPPKLLSYINENGIPSLRNSEEAIKVWILAWKEVWNSEQSGQSPSKKNIALCDLNLDNICNIRDFSILMYYSR